MNKRLSDSINVGVADIFFTPEDSSIPLYLGLTKEGVIFKYETVWHELNSDQTGKTPLDDVMIGENAVAEVKILDTSKNKIASIMSTSAIEGIIDNPSAVTFGRRPGLRTSQKFGTLRIHPVSAPDNSRDVIIYRTTNTGSLELAFKLDDEWVIPCKFKAYFDDFRKAGDQLFRIGEDSWNGKVEKRVNHIWITPSNTIKKVGTSVEFRANAMFEDGTNEDVTAKCEWTTTDPKVTLSPTNVVTATSEESASVTIKATHKDIEGIFGSTHLTFTDV